MEPLRFGDSALDSALPWGGLPQATLHEINGTAAAMGFTAALAGRLAGSKPILWCRSSRNETGSVYGPGLLPFGLNPEQVVFVEAKKKQDLLWAMEEGLRSGQPALVVGEVEAVSFVASRRLQLAAEVGGVTAFLLNTVVTKRICKKVATTSATTVALTRWVVSAEARDKSQRNTTRHPQWRVDLVHCRAGVQQSWLVEWNNEAPDANEKASQGYFTVVTELFDRQGEHRPGLREAS
jgi:protein ImuA